MDPSIYTSKNERTSEKTILKYKFCFTFQTHLINFFNNLLGFLDKECIEKKMKPYRKDGGSN